MGAVERFLDTLDATGITGYELENKLGVKNGAMKLSTLRKSKTMSGKEKSLPTDVLTALLENRPDINPYYILLGKGEMFNKPEDKITCVGSSGQGKSDTITRLANPVPAVTEKSFPSQDINLYDIDVSAGLSRLFAEDGEKNRAFLGKISIPNMPRCDGAVKVIGDSMYPLLKSGDIIAYKEVRDRRAIQWGEIYILQIEYDSDVAIVVKYVKRSEKGDDWIKLVSYNKEHDPKDIELANVKAIARVMVCIRQMGIM